MQQDGKHCAFPTLMAATHLKKVRMSSSFPWNGKKSQFQHLTQFLCFIGNRIWVYDISKSLPSVYILHSIAFIFIFFFFQNYCEKLVEGNPKHLNPHIYKKKKKEYKILRRTLRLQGLWLRTQAWRRCNTTWVGEGKVGADIFFCIVTLYR